MSLSYISTHLSFVNLWEVDTIVPISPMGTLRRRGVRFLAQTGKCQSQDSVKLLE